ncbi:T9SS type A sorting domain-containing protein [Lewinella sp. 4G2]|uniref:T9SS type A sorting domain-containing protein n=1 Tax=Lewinella sp. 4G2 TaxID=1803372 RepID=UPI0007B47292|nr:T9SS type A sorting domain-containing protein [Lewinella sp. 4G2]OAV43280.1 hypothetical protein A3850_001670 [Lewinella sp. 4G2]
MFHYRVLLMCLLILCAGGVARAAGNDVDGGMIAGNGGEIVAFCPGLELDQTVIFTSTSPRQDSNYFYAITTATDEPVVIEILDSNRFDFGPVNLEELRVYAISYTGNLAVVPGFPITLRPLSDGCFALSNNFVTIVMDTPEEGQLATRAGDDTITVNVESATESTVFFDLSNNPRLPQQLVVTDTNNLILSVFDNVDSLNFLGADAGACRVWGIAYAADPGAEPGTELTAELRSDGCAVRSVNFVRINRIKDPVSTGSEPGNANFARLKVYPNPVTDGQATLRLTGLRAGEPGFLQLLSVDGRPILTLPHPVAAEATLRLDLTDLPPGIYFAVYATSAGRAFTRFIVH